MASNLDFNRRCGAEESFRKRLRPHAISIYRRLFPNCSVSDLRSSEGTVHVLDKEFGIDTLATLESGQWISIQEKYRQNRFLHDTRFQVCPGTPDFTQEYLNAEGTKHQSPGEWFKLGAQFYFYGWAKHNESGFEKWVLLDIAKYKLIVESAGGLGKIGRKRKNSRCGMASFYAIPVTKLRSAFVYTHLDLIGKEPEPF